MTVSAVIVTWNRKVLLAECLRRVLTQTRRVDRVILIDNASSDGTPDMLRSEGFLDDPRLSHVRMDSNLGGAGGFAEGIRRARAEGADWLWLMDDDTMPRRDCLAKLMQVAQRPWRRPPSLLASRVLWTDGTVHPMNRVKALRGHRPRSSPFAIRACSFVSCLVRGSVVDDIGLPVAAYRLWMDDVEYTHRLCRRHPGIAVPASIAEHHTLAAASVFAAPADRMFVMVRNWLWMLRFSSGLRHGERLSHTLRAIYTVLRAGFQQPTPARLRAVIAGWNAGWSKPS